LQIYFFSFWQYFYKLKTKSWLSKIFLIEGVFIKSLLAIFLSHKIINSVFGLNFENYWFSQGLIIFSSCFVCYCTFLSIKTQHLKLISLLLSLSTIGFLLIILGLNQYNISHNSFVFWLLQLFFTNFFIFLLSDLLQIKNSNTKIWQLNKLKNHTFLKMIFCILITQLTFLPITFGFLASWFLLTENINSPLFWLIVFSLAVYNLAQVIFANKLLHKIIFT
jgi:NADH:ubiquinone oxidoreductase subunit 2 (subunit N)